MKVLFTADLHIKIGQKNVPVSWAKERYDTMFDEFDRVYKEYNCDLEIHGGDIFDKLPSLEELQIYYSYIARSSNKNFIIFDGNHEATKKGKTFFTYLVDVIQSLNANAEVILTPEVRHDMQFLPYCHLHKDLPNIKAEAPTLCTHVRGQIPPHVTPEVDLSYFSKWEVVLAGDLHGHSNSQLNIVYPGSPVTVTFHRNEVSTGVIVFDTVAREWEWVKIETPQLIRKTIEKETDMVRTTYHHTIYELVGNLVNLSKVDKSTALLDKKIVLNDQPATLDLSNMTIREEINLYLDKVLNLDKNQIKDILKVYDDNSWKIEI
jgi:DNA repair exonuclease SbcCD nuclease subunit